MPELGCCASSGRARWPRGARHSQAAEHSHGRMGAQPTPQVHTRAASKVADPLRLVLTQAHQPRAHGRGSARCQITSPSRCACMRACVHACVHACMCMRACVRVRSCVCTVRGCTLCVRARVHMSMHMRCVHGHARPYTRAERSRHAVTRRLHGCERRCAYPKPRCLCSGCLGPLLPRLARRPYRRNRRRCPNPAAHAATTAAAATAQTPPPMPPPPRSLGRDSLVAGQASGLQPLGPGQRCGRAATPVLCRAAPPRGRKGPAARTREGVGGEAPLRCSRGPAEARQRRVPHGTHIPYEYSSLIVVPAAGAKASGAELPSTLQ